MVESCLCRNDLLNAMDPVRACVAVTMSKGKSSKCFSSFSILSSALLISLTGLLIESNLLRLLFLEPFLSAFFSPSDTLHRSPYADCVADSIIDLEKVINREGCAGVRGYKRRRRINMIAFMMPYTPTMPYGYFKLVRGGAMSVSLMMLLLLLTTVTGTLISNGSRSVNNVVLIPVTDAIIIDEYDESLMSADGCTDSLLLSQLPTFYHMEIVASHEKQERRRRGER